MRDLEQRSIEQFNVWAKDYDRTRYWPFYFANKTVVNLLGLKNGSILLDVGCGTGILLEQLVQLHKDLKLYGIDIAPEMIKVARAKFDSESVTIQEGSANSLPYESNSFDCATCVTSFHHYPDPEHSLREILRVLKPGGKLVLLDPSTDGLLRKAVCKALDVLFKEGGTHLFTRDQMYRMFQKVGFKEIEQRTYLYYKLITIGVKEM